jgi:hypothetical protein
MTDKVGPKQLVPSAAAPKPAPKAPAQPAPAQLDTDSFVRNPPTAAQLTQMRQAVAALDALPAMPKAEAGLKAWLAIAGPAYEAAKKADSGLSSASFFHNSLPAAEAEAVFFKVGDFSDKVRDAQERLGLREPTPPADPKRPTYKGTKAVSRWVDNEQNGLTSLAGLLALPFVAAIETLDATTRKQQAQAYPAALAEYRKRKARYDAEQAKIKIK